jgi:sporulation protein YlmC with PRC-barrel domain
MKRATRAGSIAPAIWLGLCVGLCLGLCCGLAAQALAVDAGAADNPPASGNKVSAAKPALGADVPAWRRQQIASALPLTSKDAPMRYEELLGTEVRNPKDELLGSITDLVRNPQTDKMAYLVIAPDKNIGIGDKNVPVPVEDFKITPEANLLVLEASKGALAAAPRVNPFSSDGIDLQRRKVDAYWQAHLSH